MSQTSLTNTSRFETVRGLGAWLVWPALIVLTILLAYGITNSYWLQVVINAEVMIIAAVGLYVAFGLNGQVALGQAAFYAIGGYSVGLLVTSTGIDMVWAIIVGVVLASIVGVAIGIPVLRLKGHYLALATLGFGQVVALILINWSWLSGGANGVRNIVAPLIAGFELRTVPEWGVFIGIVAVASIFVVVQIKKSSYGRAMEAVRDSPVAAAAMGISVPRVRVLAFTIGAAFAGLAGALNAGFVTYISPGTYDLVLSVAFLSMVIVGGVRSPWGAVVGAILLTFLPELLRPVQSYYMLIYGILLLTIVAFVPGGVLRLAGDLVGWVRGLVTGGRKHDPEPQEVGR